MHLLDWAFSSFRDKGKTPPEKTPEQGSAWRGGKDLPTGLAEADQFLRKVLLRIAGLPGVGRIVLLRANGGLFCGKFDTYREEFSRSIQQIISEARKASRRTGLGAIETVVVEGPQGALILAAGHSACGVQSSGETDADFILEKIEQLTGVQPEGGRE